MRTTAIAVAMEAQAARRATAKCLKTLPSGWRNSTMPMQSVTYLIGKEEITLAYNANATEASR